MSYTLIIQYGPYPAPAKAFDSIEAAARAIYAARHKQAFDEDGDKITYISLRKGVHLVFAQNFDPKGEWSVHLTDEAMSLAKTLDLTYYKVGYTKAGKYTTEVYGSYSDALGFMLGLEKQRGVSLLVVESSTDGLILSASRRPLSRWHITVASHEEGSTIAYILNSGRRGSPRGWLKRRRLRKRIQRDALKTLGAVATNHR